VYSTGSPTDPVAELQNALAGVAGEDRSWWSGPARAQRVVELVALADAVQAEVARAVGDWDRDAAWAADGALNPVSWLIDRTPLSAGAAARLVHTARLAREHPATKDALARGEVPYANLETIARVVRRRERFYSDGEALLLKWAAALPPVEFERFARHWRSTVDDLADSHDANAAHERRYLHASATFYGTVRGDFELDAEGGATLLRALDARTETETGDGPEPARDFAQRRADALVEMAAESIAAEPSADEVGAPDMSRGRPNVGLDVVVDVGTLGGSPDPGSMRCEITGVGPVSVDSALRMACDAAVARVIMRSESEVLDLGRRQRVVSRALRRALVIRDRGCVFPGCRRPARWCDVHHCVPWSQGGTTDLVNCVLLCRRHHMLCHEGKWTIRREHDGTMTTVSPTGVVTRVAQHHPMRT
jgi:hypothetical protein